MELKELYKYIEALPYNGHAHVMIAGNFTFSVTCTEGNIKSILKELKSEIDFKPNKYLYSTRKNIYIKFKQHCK